jgi:hypothetical protein
VRGAFLAPAHRSNLTFNEPARRINPADLAHPELGELLTAQPVAVVLLVGDPHPEPYFVVLGVDGDLFGVLMRDDGALLTLDVQPGL